MRRIISNWLVAVVLIVVAVAGLTWMAGNLAYGSKYATSHLLALGRLAGHSPGRAFALALTSIRADMVTWQISLVILLLVMTYVLLSSFMILSHKYPRIAKWVIRGVISAVVIVCLVLVGVWLWAIKHPQQADAAFQAGFQALFLGIKHHNPIAVRIGKLLGLPGVR